MRIMNSIVIFVLFAFFLFLCYLLFLSKVNCLDASERCGELNLARFVILSREWNE